MKTLRAEDIFAAVGGVDDALIERCEGHKKRPVVWLKYGAMAAAAVLVVTIGLGVTGRGPLRIRIGGMAGGGSSSAPSGGSSNGSGYWGSQGADSAGPAEGPVLNGDFDGIAELEPPAAPADAEGDKSPAAGAPEYAPSYMSYAGPVLPLTTAAEANTLTTKRNITFDFAPQDRGSWAAGVTDAYTLTNSTAQDVTVTALYPFTTRLSELGRDLPALTLNGQELETSLTVGRQGTDGPDSWADYVELLTDGSYLQDAMGDYPDFSGVPVTVYKFTDPYGPEPDEKTAPNPSIRAHLTLDYERTTVLSYGFNGTHYAPDAGEMTNEYSIPHTGETDAGQPRYLIAVGEDVGGLTTGCYVTGGTSPDTARCEGGVTVTRYETDLESALREILPLWWEADQRVQCFQQGVSSETYVGLFKDWLAVSGPLSADGPFRWQTSLEENDVDYYERVCWVSAEVAVPAGGSVTLTASMIKRASTDYTGPGKGRQGYDLATTLGSNLTFTRQTATLVNTGELTITEQNFGFGFDPEGGETTVELDLNRAHYYLELSAR